MKNLLSQPNQFDIFDQLFEPNILSTIFNSDYIPTQYNHAYNETNDQATVTVDVPGFEKSEISIDYDNDILTVSAKKESESESRTNINKSFRIPNIDIKKSKATLENGVLTLVLEKTRASKKQGLKIS